MKKNFERQLKGIEGHGATKRLKQQSTLVDIRNVLKVANTGYPGNCESTSGTYAQQCNLFYNYESSLAECHLCVILCKHVPETEAIAFTRVKNVLSFLSLASHISLHLQTFNYTPIPHPHLPPPPQLQSCGLTAGYRERKLLLFVKSFRENQNT